MTGAEPQPQPPRLLERLRAFGGQSLAYTVIGALGRNVSIVLVPLYAAELSTTQYGTLGLALAVNALLLITLGAGLQAAITRLTFELETEAERQRLYATLLLFTLAVPGALCVALEAAGSAGALDLPGLPYDPFGRLTLWASYFGLVQALPQAIFVTRGEPAKVVALAGFTALSVVIPTVLLVGVAGRGAEGALEGLLIGAVVSAAGSLLVLARLARRRPSRALLAAALAFALPLLPHSVAQWGLSLADRFILAHYLTTGDVGRYVLGYQVGSLAAIATLAISQALSPFVTRHLKDPRTSGEVPRIGTYALGAMLAACLAVAVTADDLVALIAGPAFAESGTVAAVIALAFAFQGVYYVTSQGTWFAMRTRAVPLVTAGSVALVLGLDLLLVPDLGIVAAAGALAAGYAAMAIAQGWLAHRQHPIPWELGRWLRLALAAAAVEAAALLAGPGPGLAGLLVDGAILALGLPLALTALGFWDDLERARLSAFVAARRPRRGAPSPR